jgi:hypothetical protein
MSSMMKSASVRRVAAGITMIVIAIGWGAFEMRDATGRADRDFALCGQALNSLECRAQQRPISVSSVRSSDNAFQEEYELGVQTGAHTIFYLTGLTAVQAEDLRGLTTLEVRYKGESPVALIAPDGTPLEIPLSIGHAFWQRMLKLMLLFALGVAVLIWGVARAARGPRVRYAY